MDTTADILARALDLPPIGRLLDPVPSGTCCAITGAPIAHGYPVMEITTDATNEFIDTFHGEPHGWLSESAARCFKGGGPGGALSRAVVAFADGTCYQPLIARESARAQERHCWSELARGIWPRRRGEPVVILLTTDTKKRLWPRARVGPLGAATPVLLYDSSLAAAQTPCIDWPRMLDVLCLVEQVYSAGFSKRAICEGITREWNVAQRVGMGQTLVWERALRHVRPQIEFMMAILIAQRDPIAQKGEES